MAGKITVDTLQKIKAEGGKITALTAYDYAMATLVDQAGIDIILVGDSLGMTFRGEENTLKVTVDDVAYHIRAVRRGVRRAMLVADMPFLSHRVGVQTALQNAGKLVTAGATAVKIEGAEGMSEVIKAMLSAGIPVMGHIGLTPQSVHKLGGFKIQGKGPCAAGKILDEALSLEADGVFAIVLECVPVELAELITSQLKIPTIGIGAGPGCDGQILVTNDLLGLTSGFTPKFVKKYADLASIITGAAKEYADEIRSGAFPDEEHSYTQRHLKAI